MSNKTQDLLPFYDIKDNLIFLNDGSVSTVLKTSAVNFGLLSEIEQVSIIESFAGLLNSLSFAIQIVIHSQRLDVSSYLSTLDQALKTQHNPLLAALIPRYRAFVERMIKENDVLDKQFYIAVNVSVPELGLISKGLEDKTKKATTILDPRLDHLSRQLARLGLKSKQLTTQELVTFFYNAYNSRLDPVDQTSLSVPASIQNPVKTQAAVATAPVQQPTPIQTPAPNQNPQPTVAVNSGLPNANPNPIAAAQFSIPRPANAPAYQTAPVPNPRPAAPANIAPIPAAGHTAPFVVEELTDDIHG